MFSTIHNRVLGLLIATLLPGVAFSQSAMPEMEALPDAVPMIYQADVEAYLDGIIEARMKSYGVAGTTVSVVYDGEIVLAKGYGYADVNEGTRVDADRTLFRPGSISKTFTWTAVMQLVEQGKIDLNGDLRNYVDDVEIPNDIGDPITMAHLMSHTPGLEATALGHLFENNADEVLTLHEYLLQYPRKQVRAPGTKPAYSNYGAALAGHVVAKVSGISFETYVEQNIFQPLGMDHSTFREPWGIHLPDPISDKLRAEMSKGYQRKAGGFVAGEYEFIHPVGPAGALSTTATDMARFMLMHLGDGTYEGTAILEPETAQRMHSQHWAPSDTTTGWAHGFIVYDIAGYPAYGHSGGTLHFLSDMIMVPELNLGIFVSSNTPTGAKVMDGLATLVVKRYFGDRAGPLPEPIEGFGERAAKISGAYVSTRRPYSVVESLIMSPSLVVNFSASDDGHLLMSAGGETTRWVETAPYLIRQVEGTNVMQFDTDSAGNVIGVPQYLPSSYLEKVGPFRNPQTLLSLVGASVAVFIATLIGAWLRRKQQLQQTKGERFAAMTTLYMAGLWVLWAILTGASILPFAENVSAAMYGFPSATFKFALSVALLATLFTGAATILLAAVWKDRNWAAWRRIRHTLVVFLGLATALVLHGFNALGYHYY